MYINIHIHRYMYILGNAYTQVSTRAHKCTCTHTHMFITGNIRSIIYIILVGFSYHPITIAITSMDTRDSQNNYVRPLHLLFVKKLFEICLGELC